MEEKRIEINGFSDYYINIKGEIWRKEGNKIKKLTPSMDTNGYFFIGLHKEGKRYQRRINRLVAEHFLLNPENKPEVHHKDFNIKNNNVENLEWCTKLENMGYNSKNPKYTDSFTATDIFKKGLLSFLGINSWPAVLNFLTKNAREGKLKACQVDHRWIIKASDWNAFIENYTASARL
jgi:hypothetical protein